MRRSYPELEHLITVCLQIFPGFGGKYSYTRKTWEFPGAALKLRHLDRDADADRFQGHEYPFLAFDEVSAWANPAPLYKLKACLRNSDGIPSRLVLTGNPGGAGQQWIKDRYIRNGHAPYEMVKDEDIDGWTRTFIPAKITDNPILLESDPTYIDRLKLVGSPALVRCWLDGDWDVVPGMFLEGVWDASVHIVEPFDIPENWRRWRAYDHGFAAPGSVGWYCQDPDGIVYRYREMYIHGHNAYEGARMDVGEIAEKIKIIEKDEIDRGIKFMNNPADSSIWMEDGRYKSINDIFREHGVEWVRASKGAGSRVNGAQEIIHRLNTRTFFVFNTCKHFIDIVPSIPADKMNPEDVDTTANDHIFDEWKYSMMSRRPKTRNPKKEHSIAGTFDWVAADRKTNDKPMRIA